MERYPDGARIEKGPGGLDRLALHAAEAEALVYLQGAHVAHFQPKGGRAVLWMSAASRFETGKPLRGGVPICFPWFGAKAGSPEAPLHGYARILPWNVAAVTRETGGALRAVPLIFGNGRTPCARCA
jgi:D-hexose-6-phosphate mutarotase